MSSILSKVFEHCILDRNANYFGTNVNQVGFKKVLIAAKPCTVRKIANRFIGDGSFVNLCDFDFSKAFDIMQSLYTLNRIKLKKHRL